MPRAQREGALNATKQAPDDPYEILGVSPGASSDEIKSAYRELTKLHHPDVNPGREEAATERIRAITVAYEQLTNPQPPSLPGAGALAPEPDPTWLERPTFLSLERWLLGTLIFGALALAGGYLIGQTRDDEVAAARTAGADLGRQQGERIGADRGSERGRRKGYKETYQPAKDKAFNEAKAKSAKPASPEEPSNLDIPSATGNGESELDGASQ